MKNEEDAFLDRYAQIIDDAIKKYGQTIGLRSGQKIVKYDDFISGHAQAATLSSLDSIQAEIDRHQKSADVLSETITVLSVKLEVQRRIIADLKGRPSKVARSGGHGKAAKFKALEAETLRIFNQGKWASATAAAFEITPQIVALSRKGNGDLSPTTLKPLQWIRKEIRRVRPADGKKEAPA